MRAGTETDDGNAPPERTSDVLLKLVEDGQTETITLDMIVETLRGRAFGLLLFAFALPACFPMPPGIPAFCGVMIMLIGLHLVLGRETIWFPEIIARRSIERRQFAGIVERILPWVGRMEKMARPRVPFASSRLGKAFVGVVALSLGFILLLPIPILGNMPPGIAIVVIGLGMTERDGVLVLAGFVVAAFSIAINGAFVWGVITAIGYMLANL